ncbi:hypothetical protein [Salmonella enterica]|uniref:hypothetical protein n=1 Tax=Salmonella enterica TaxID=28901 RepID=UPI001ED9B7EA|nr:hypothetical protein [Salmonella enterica]
MDNIFLSENEKIPSLIAVITFWLTLCSVTDSITAISANAGYSVFKSSTLPI